MWVSEDYQAFLSALAKNGCYVLQLVRVAQETRLMKYGVLEAISVGVENGSVIYYRNAPLHKDNFFVQDAEKFLASITGSRFSVRKETLQNYRVKEGEWKINRYEYENSEGVVVSHFLRDDFNTLVTSKAVRWGKWKSSRIVRLLD